jgi:putative flavoprotein involved in K+ transport
MRSPLDVIVVGAGQAGLAMGYHLARSGSRFAILDAAPAVGYSWRKRWDSLTLFTPARYSGLPGLPFPAPADHYPGKDEVGDYLEAYARAFSLPVWPNERVRSLRGDGTGTYTIQTECATYAAPQVVIATGPFQEPFVPRIASDLDPGVLHLHSSQYRSPRELPEGAVLVVGAGNSGVQIAAEIARSHRTYLSMGERRPRLPERMMGRSLFWWLERTGAMNVTVHSPIGRRMKGRELLVGASPEMVARRYGVRLVGRAMAARGRRVQTECGPVIEPAAIIWATGFRPDYRWIDLPVFDGSGRPLQQRGVTALPGLYFLGISWMHTRGSGLIGWVGRDAAHLASRIAERHHGALPKSIVAQSRPAVPASSSP